MSVPPLFSRIARVVVIVLVVVTDSACTAAADAIKDAVADPQADFRNFSVGFRVARDLSP